jgi:membrane protein
MRLIRPAEAWRIGKDAGVDFIRDDAAAHAAAVSFYTVLSLAPLLLITVAVAGFFAGREGVREELLGQFGSLMGDEGRKLIETLLTNADQPRKGAAAMAIGVIAAVIGATGAFVQLKSALNSVWEVRAGPSQGPWYRSAVRFVLTRLLSLAMVLALGFLLLVSLVVNAGLAALGRWASGVMSAPEGVWHAADFAVSLGVITVLLALIFKLLPDARIGWREVWLGAGVTALLFSIGKFLIGMYLGKSGVTSVYGAAGSVVLVLLWIYYSAMILLMGAEITQATARRLGKAIRPARGFVLEQEGPAAGR